MPRGERRMADERIGHEALELEAFRRLQARGHLDEEVGVEPPVRDAEAEEAGGLVMRRERDEALGRFAPQRRRQVEGELQAHETKRGLPREAPLGATTC